MQNQPTPPSNVSGIIAAIAGGLARILMGILSAALLKRGIETPDGINELLVGALVGVLTLGWMTWTKVMDAAAKLIAEKREAVALALPADATKRDVTAVMDAVAVPAGAPATDVTAAVKAATATLPASASVGEVIEAVKADATAKGATP